MYRAATFAALVFIARVSALSQALSPESFQIAAFADHDWIIMDVQPVSQSETRVVFTAIFPACGTYHVNQEEHVFEAAAVAQLAGKADICTPEKIFARTISSYAKKRQEEIWSDRQGISARCGSDVLVHTLPPRASLRFQTLQSRAPKIAALWSLGQDIISLYVKETNHELFAGDPDWRANRIRKRNSLEEAALEIRSGAYDLILPDIPLNWRKDDRAKLSETMPSPEEAAGFDEDFGQVESAQSLGLPEGVRVTYPQMARIAHIEGDVKAELQIEANTGKVLSANATSGHPILKASVSDNAKHWILPHPYFGANPVSIVVRFHLRCPPIIESSQTMSVRPKKKPKPKKP